MIFEAVKVVRSRLLGNSERVRGDSGGFLSGRGDVGTNAACGIVSASNRYWENDVYDVAESHLERGYR